MGQLNIYQSIILKHSKSPNNFKKLDPCTHSSAGNNPLCGDKVEIFTNIKSNIIDEIKPSLRRFFFNYQLIKSKSF